MSFFVAFNREREYSEKNFRIPVVVKFPITCDDIAIHTISIPVVFFHRDVGQALRNVSYSDVTFRLS